MTSRQLTLMALAIAAAVQAAAVLTLGPLSDWCFCAMNRIDPPPTPPPYVLRFVRLAIAPDEWAPRGLGLPLVFGFNLVVWFLAALALLHGMALAARVRIRPPGREDGRRIRLAGAGSVRPWQMLSIGCVLIALGMMGGATVRQRWLAEAEQVFAATMAAASTGRPLPPHVAFSMVERRSRKYVYPASGFVIDVDLRKSGDHFLDRFVVPYEYGGWARFPSGARYEFTVERGTIGWPAEEEGWMVNLYEEHIFRR